MPENESAYSKTMLRKIVRKWNKCDKISREKINKNNQKRCLIVRDFSSSFKIGNVSKNKKSA